MTFMNDPGESRQTLEELAHEHQQIQSDLQRYRCPKCDCFGVVFSKQDYFGAIYRCNCQPMFWVICPETGEKIEL